MHNELKFSKVIETISQLERRIIDRFPNSGLLNVCHGLHETAIDAQHKASVISKPNKYIRIGVVSTIVLFFLILIFSITLFDWQFKKPDVTVVIQMTEALINEIILLGVAIFFLVSLEVRVKRKLALKALYQLRDRGAPHNLIPIFTMGQIPAFS